MLPSQAKREVVNLFTHSKTHISSPPFVETVDDDDDINCKRRRNDNETVVHMFNNSNHVDNENEVHVIDAYADEFYVSDNEVDNTFFEDSFVAT